MIVKTAVVLGKDFQDLLRTIDGIETMKHHTRDNCEICGKPFIDDADPASLWFGVVLAPTVNTIVILPLHRDCTKGMDQDAVSAAMEAGMQRFMPTMVRLDTTELDVIILPEAQAELDKIAAEHPEVREVVREFMANVRQARQGVIEGRYASFEDAMEAITGSRPEPMDECDDEDDDDDD
jgi:hypothetical protein